MSPQDTPDADDTSNLIRAYDAYGREIFVTREQLSLIHI